MEIILFQPEIPPNTGNVVRTCKATNCRLTLVRPLGFSTSDKALRRAGLDYWDGVDVAFIDDLPRYLAEQERPFYMLSSFGSKSYTEVTYESNAILIFGSETRGLPKEYFTKWPKQLLTIPMQPEARCLNLSNSVAIVLYEAMRQQNFSFLPQKTLT